MNPAELGLAIIGTGGHLPDTSAVAAAGARVVATLDPADSTPTELLARAARLVADPSVELVAVDLTPRQLQVDVAETALRAGRHVLIERPAATSTRDLARLAAAESPGARVWERATPFVDEPYGRMSEIAASGEIGDVVLVTAARSYPWAEWRPADEAVAGGLVLQSAGYGLDIARLASGRSVRDVRVLDTRTASDGGPLRAAVVTADLDGGVLASVSVDYLHPPGGAWARDEVRVLGSVGVLHVDGVARSIEVTTPSGSRREIVPPSRVTLLGAVVAAIRDGDTAVSPEVLRASTAALVRALDTDRTTVGPGSALEEGRG